MSQWRHERSLRQDTRRDARAARAQARNEGILRRQQEAREVAVEGAKVVLEWGIEEEALQHLNWVQDFDMRGWKNLTKQRPPSNYELVKQFYREVDVDEFMRSGRVMLQDKEVIFTHQTINAYFGISHPLRQEYGWSDAVQEMGDEELLLVLCGPEHNKKVADTCPKEMDERAQIWNIFMCQNLTPVSRRMFTTDRLRCLYALRNGLPVNVGRVILQQLRDRLTGKMGHKSLIFPSMITDFFRRAGLNVDHGGEEMLQHPNMDLVTINKVRTNRGLPLLQRSRSRSTTGTTGSGSHTASSSEATASAPPDSSGSSSRVAVEILLRGKVEKQEELNTIQEHIIALLSQGTSPNDPRLAQLAARKDALRTEIHAVDAFIAAHCPPPL